MQKSGGNVIQPNAIIVSAWVFLFFLHIMKYFSQVVYCRLQTTHVKWEFPIETADSIYASTDKRKIWEKSLKISVFGEPLTCSEQGLGSPLK